jgi:outer membrane protein, multidrug efflux system
MRKSLVLLLLLSFSSCVLHRPYQRPEIELPDTWRLPTSDIAVIANLDWWNLFGDPILNGLIDEALENNKDLKVAIARVYEFWAQYKIVRSQMLPQFFGTASEFRQEQSLIQGVPPPGREYSLFNLAINFSFEVDIWGRLACETEAALANYLAKIETRRTVVLTLVSSVATTYIFLRQLDMQLQIAERTQASRENSLKIAIDRYLGGLTSEMEVKQAESEVDSAIAQVKEIEIQQQQQENLLSILLARPPGEIQRGLAVDELALPVDVPTGLPSQLLEQRPDIIQAEQVLVAANASIGTAMAQAFPDISLTGLYGNSSLDLRHLLTAFTRTWQLGSSYFQSVYSGGRITAQIEVADAQFQEALYAYEQTILTSLQEVNDSLIAHQKTKELAKVQQHQVSVLSDYLELANLQYSNGQTDYLNVLDAERTLFVAQLNYAESQANCFITLVNLYKALGGGWVLEADKQAAELF